jgi:hypothetical protein
MSDEVRAIEEFFRRRYGRHALYVPSGRLALYLAFREWLRPGDRVLMSPVNDDVVFFTVLAAGLVPVVGPVDLSTGNLDAAAIEDSAWTRLSAVLTTNLYGMPDRMDLLEERCRRHDLLLIEDAAHAIDSHFGGRRIGEFGVAAAYSMSKHVGVFGGVLTFADDSRRDSLARRAAELIRHRPVHVAAVHRLRALLGTVGTTTRLRKWVAARRDRLIARPRERAGHRIVYDAGALRDAQMDGGGLDRFERWVRVDNHLYRTWPLRSVVRETLRRLNAFEEIRQPRLAGARRLMELGLTPPGFAPPAETALLRVPLLVPNRERVRASLAAQGLKTYYIYDPPLDLYAPELVESLGPTGGSAAWTRDVLPVDPLVAERFLTVIERSPGLLEPSTHAAAYTQPARFHAAE